MSTTTLCCVCKTRNGELYPKFSHILKKPVCPICLEGEGDYLNRHHEGLASRLPTFSIEFEVHGPGAACERALALLGCGYLRTADGTVSDEYKSPIYHSLTAFRSHIPVLDSLHDLVDFHCGTHLHVGFPASLVDDLDYLRGAIFSPLANFLEENDALTKHFWGRYFCEFANSSFFDSYPWLCFPTRHHTLEYRLPRFQDGVQFLEVVRFCRRTTYFLQQSLRTLEHLEDPYGRSSEAVRLGLTPAQMGNRLLIFYKEALRRLTRARCLQAKIIQLPYSAS